MEEQPTKEGIMSQYVYAVGDLVYFRREVEGFELYGPRLPYASWKANSIHLPYPVAIVGRQLDECHGGIQDFYLIHLGDRDRSARCSPWELLPSLEASTRIMAVLNIIREI